MYSLLFINNLHYRYMKSCEKKKDLDDAIMDDILNDE